jgi:hypothetical protein
VSGARPIYAAPHVIACQPGWPMRQAGRLYCKLRLWPAIVAAVRRVDLPSLRHRVKATEVFKSSQP